MRLGAERAGFANVARSLEQDSELFDVVAKKVAVQWRDEDGEAEEVGAEQLRAMGFDVAPTRDLRLIGWRVKYRERWDTSSQSVFEDVVRGGTSHMTEHVELSAEACWTWIGLNATRRETETEAGR